MGYSLDLTQPGGAATAETSYAAQWAAGKAIDNDEATLWNSDAVSAWPEWWKYDFGAGNSYKIARVRIMAGYGSPIFSQRFKDFKIYGSTDDINYDLLYTGQHANDYNWETYDFTNNTAYRYIRIDTLSTYTVNYVGIHEIELIEYTADIVWYASDS